MNIITKQRDENLKNFNPFKIIFCKYKDKKEEEEKQVIIPNKTETVIDIPKKSIQLADTRSPTYLGQTHRRIPQRSENHYSEEFVAKNFKSYRIGEVLNISSKRYTVSKIPNIDYSRTYLPFFLLVRNGFLREN